MTQLANCLTRQEIADLLAHVIYRTIQRPQNLAPSEQDCLDVIANEVLTVSKPVNGSREPGEPRWT